MNNKPVAKAIRFSYPPLLQRHSISLKSQKGILTMINRLKTHFPHAVADASTPAGYQLLVSLDSGEQLILDKRELSPDETGMLKKLFDTKEPSSSPYNEPARSFHRWLIEGNDDGKAKASEHVKRPCRFVYVHFSAHPENDPDLNEVIESFFPGTVVQLWRTPQDLVIVQEINEWFEDTVPFDSIIDTLATDFFINIGIYAGSLIPSPDDVSQVFTREIRIYDGIKPLFAKKKSFHEQEAMIYFILLQLPRDMKHTLLEPLAAIRGDSELKETITIYLRHNLNTSSAAKEMYLHRNTMQYRLDKFIEKTALDIKHFPNAAACYLMLALEGISHKEPWD
ncbi:PucR family transcriptional regulator [Salisediminibacterium beveridgei]|uniref:Fis-type helix-turn-helix domain protein n=1 Tax=Salisediminibacterium beveridgei TaxID=632773 RepID=A0A1D7QTV0_9BACI|nr:helix-turn-helix domain-containing protein [Salisediminibacterium beveridgei]AOM82444.1 Fis-type helix-turn-helix domain protein [Salisediminibacterium beveridgei]